MQVNLMLADYATVHQGKLFISGAGINLMVIPATEPYVLNFGLGITVNIPWTATNQNHRLRIALVDTDEHIVPVAAVPPGAQVPEEDRGAILGNFNAGRSPSMAPGRRNDGTRSGKLPVMSSPVRE